MSRVLFVDDEVRLLEGIERALIDQADVWDMVFAPGPEAALAALDEAPFDVVVSDLRMPGMDGTTFLRTVRERHPASIRIVLSGNTELQTTLRTVPVAHQYLSKPCDLEVLKGVIERACSLQALIGDEVVRSLVGKIDDLPVQPRVYVALRSALADETVTIGTIAAIVEQDVGLSAKLLQLVNSAFFGAPQHITNIENTVRFLGVSVLGGLVLSEEILRGFEGGDRRLLPLLDEVRRHSCLCAGIARQLVADAKLAEEAATAALLHDVGRLVLASRMPDLGPQCEALCKSRGLAHWEAEREILGASHAEAGAYLLGLWGLPLEIVESVACHHLPERLRAATLDLPALVFVADALAEAQGQRAAKGRATPADEKLWDFLERIGMGERFPEFKEIAAARAA